MIIKKVFTSALATAAMFSIVTSAHAAAFASFSTIGEGSSVRWENSGTNGTLGAGGTFFTVDSAASTVAGARAVSFSFLQPEMSPFVSNITASFSMSANTTEGNAATLVGNFLVQAVTAGTFSFLSTTDIIVGDRTFAAGSNLLSGSFSTSSITGERNGTTGEFAGSTLGGSTIAYSSDFLTFDDLAQLEFGLSMTSITSVLQAIPTQGNPTRALRTFRGLASGSFSSDPNPLVSAIPEPAEWGMMLVGFAMVGLQTRRRSNNGTAVRA